MDEIDELTLDVSSGGGDGFVLDAGKHAVELRAVLLEKNKPNTYPGKQGTFFDELKFVFRSLKPAGEEEGENAGKYGVISHWVAVTKYDTSHDTKSKLTHLLNWLFGRKLTPDEARALSLKRLVGIQGYVIVGVNKNGKNVFNSFILPKNRPAPNPADYAKIAGTPVLTNEQKPAPKAVTMDDAGEIDPNEFEDPFED